jgi:CheY-like chemotaxis protein
MHTQVRLGCFWTPQVQIDRWKGNSPEPVICFCELQPYFRHSFTVMERLRSNPHLSCIPLIVVSARDPKGNKERALQCGALAYLQKPVKNEQLLGVVRKLIENEVSNEFQDSSCGR